MSKQAGHAKSRRTAARSTRQSLPAGVESLSIAIRLSPSHVNADNLIGVLSALPSFKAADDSPRVQGILKGGSRIKGGHAHLFVNRLAPDRALAIELELIPDVHGDYPRGTLTIEEAMDLVKEHLTNPSEEHLILMSAAADFSLKSRRPAFDLPLAAPGLAEAVPGAPSIAGVDLAFPEAKGAKSLHRAFLTTFREINRMTLKVLFSTRAIWSHNLTNEAITLFKSILPIFVRTRDRDEA